MNSRSREIQPIFERLESHEFSAEINVCSDLLSIEKAIFSNDAVIDLKRQCKIDPLITAEVIERIRLLVNMSPDPRYESPWDIAISTYLLILSFTNSPATFLAASIVQNAAQLWWAERITNRLLTKYQTPIDFTNTLLETESIIQKPEGRWVWETSPLSFRETIADSVIVGNMIKNHSESEWGISLAEIKSELVKSTSNSPKEIDLSGAGDFLWFGKTDSSSPAMIYNELQAA